MKWIHLSASVFTGIFLFLFSPAAAAQNTDFEEIVRRALAENPDVLAAAFEAESELLNYKSVVAGGFPSLGFTSDAVNSPLYRYSDGEEFSMTDFTSGRVIRHRAGGGLNLGFDLPTGGSLDITGSGSLDVSLSEGSDEWTYLVNPTVTGYLRQPLFTDRLTGAPLRFDSAGLAAELAGNGTEQAEISRITAENQLILAVASAAAGLNGLKRSKEILRRRLDLADRNLELLREDEKAGKSSNIDRLAQELSLRKQQEALIELEFRISSAEYNLNTLSGISNPGMIVMTEPEGAFASDGSLGVRAATAARRMLELIASVSPMGAEPVLEVSGSVRRSDQDASADLQSAFEDAASAGMNFSLSLALSLPVIDWGKASLSGESERKGIEAAEMRTASAARLSQQAVDAAERRLELIAQKIGILRAGLDYDSLLLERERLRYEAGLTSELAVITVELDLAERESNIDQLLDERVAARLELLNTQGVELGRLYHGGQNDRHQD